MPPVVAPPARGGARRRLLEAAVDVIRRQGLSATSVDDLCAAAGVSKGAFFHHFESKEALAVAAARHWSETTGELFAHAGYHDRPDPLARLLAYVEFRDQLVGNDAPAFTCLVGTMVQEAYATHPEIRQACADSILGHAATLEADFEAAIASAGRQAELEPADLARFTQVVLQGAFVVAKAAADPAVVHAAIGHLHRYLQLILHPTTPGAPPMRHTPHRSDPAVSP